MEKFTFRFRSKSTPMPGLGRSSPMSWYTPVWRTSVHGRPGCTRVWRSVWRIKLLSKQGKLPKLAGLGQTWGNKSPAEAQFAYGMALVAVDLFFQYHAELGIRNLLNNPNALAGITEDLDRRLRE